MTVILWVASAILVVIGVAGTVLPALPGTPLVFGGLILAAWADGFTRVGWGTLVALGLLTALSFIAEFAAASLGTQRAGASRAAVVGATAGMIIGLFLGLPGILLGPFVGAAAGELAAGRGIAQAGRAGAGAWVGLLLGTISKLALAFVMIGVFLAAYFL